MLINTFLYIHLEDRKSCIRKSYIRKFSTHFSTSKGDPKSIKNCSTFAHPFVVDTKAFFKLNKSDTDDKYRYDFGPKN